MKRLNKTARKQKIPIKKHISMKETPEQPPGEPKKSQWM